MAPLVHNRLMFPAGTRAAIFLDRDGTIIEDRGYLADPGAIAILPGALEGLRQLSAVGFPLVVVTNQSGIGRGLCSAGEVEAVNSRLCALLAEQGIIIAGVYTCPHHPREGCPCRKPAPGLITRASAALGLRSDRSYMIGDRLSDVQLAMAVGARGILLASDPSSADAIQARSLNVAIAADLLEASTLVGQIQ